MKKVFSVLRSMRFANLLLALVALLCGLSSLLPQGRENHPAEQRNDQGHLNSVFSM